MQVAELISSFWSVQYSLLCFESVKKINTNFSSYNKIKYNLVKVVQFYYFHIMSHITHIILFSNSVN